MKVKNSNGYSSSIFHATLSQPAQAANKFQCGLIQIGSIEPKLWKIREIIVVKFDWYNMKSIPYFSFMKYQELV